VGLFGRSKKARQAELDAIRTQIAAISDQVHTLVRSENAHTEQLETLLARLNGLDARIVQVGHEVTHQLGELSGDIDTLSTRSNQLASDMSELTALPQMVDGVKSDQARLANEQARYEIAFRQDLAEIVEMLTKRRSA
jgi:chromosome segregation ATPase